MKRRNKYPSEHERKLQMLGILGFIPGQPVSEEAKGLIRGLMIWTWGVQHTAGKSPLQLSSRHIFRFIRFYAPSHVAKQLAEVK